MTPRTTQKATARPSPGKINVHAEDPCDHVSGSIMTLNSGQQPQDVVLACGR